MRVALNRVFCARLILFFCTTERSRVRVAVLQKSTMEKFETILTRNAAQKIFLREPVCVRGKTPVRSEPVQKSVLKSLLSRVPEQD